MCFDDFFQYFSITAICHYNQNWKYSYTKCRYEYFPKKPLRAVEQSTPLAHSVIQFQPIIPQENKEIFEVLTFKLDEAIIEETCVLSFHQIHARHMDETLRGEYIYAGVQAIICISQTNEKNEPYLKQLYSIETPTPDSNCVSIVLENGLTSGLYTVFYRFSWTNLHQECKATISIYSPVDILLEHNNEPIVDYSV